MHVDNVDTNNLFLATNSNKILHATCIGNKVTPNFYRGNEMGQLLNVFLRNQWIH